MTDLYGNIIGTRNKFLDGGLALDAPPPGPKATVLGATTSQNLQIGQPVVFTSKREAIQLSYLDNYQGPSELSYGIEEAFAGGAEQVEVVKIADTIYSEKQRWEAMVEALDNLLNTNVQMVIFCGVRADRVVPADEFDGEPWEHSWAWLMADFCYRMTRFNRSCKGAISMRNPLEIAAEVYAGTQYDDGPGTLYTDLANATVVKGIDTEFTDLSAGDEIVVDGQTRTVAVDPTSDEELSVTLPFSPTLLFGVAYDIVRDSGSDIVVGDAGTKDLYFSSGAVAALDVEAGDEIEIGGATITLADVSGDWAEASLALSADASGEFDLVKEGSGRIGSVGTAVTGVGTAFLTEVRDDDVLRASGGEATVDGAPALDTSLVVDAEFDADLSAGTYFEKVVDGLGSVKTVAVTVTGYNTNFLDLKVGQGIVIGNEVRRIASITSSTVLTLESGFSSDYPAGTSYGYTDFILGTISSAGTTVTGSATGFSTDLEAGQKIVVGTIVKTIVSITDADTMVVDSAFEVDLPLGRPYEHTSDSALAGWLEEDDALGSYRNMEEKVRYGTPTLKQMQRWVNETYGFTYAPELDGAGVLGTDSEGHPTQYKLFLGTEDDGNTPASFTDAVRDERGWPIDLGKYIAVTAFPAVHTNSLARSIRADQQQGGYYNGVADAYYAGFQLPRISEDTASNKGVGSLLIQRNLSMRQVNNLVGSRFMTAQTKTRGLVWSAANTFAWNTGPYSRSDYVAQSTVNITFEVAQLIRDTADPFLGNAKAGTLGNMEVAIRNAMDGLIRRGALIRYDIAITQTEAQRILMEATCDVELVTPFEIRQLRTTIGLSKQ